MDGVSYREYVRSSILMLFIVLVGAIYGAAAFGSAIGGALVLSIIWFVIKSYRPAWTTGWSGAWLYITGLVTVIASSVFGFQGRVNPWAVGFGLATGTVVPVMLVWKSFQLLSGGSIGGDGESEDAEETG